jgi:hypothetical protein
LHFLLFDRSGTVQTKVRKSAEQIPTGDKRQAVCLASELWEQIEDASWHRPAERKVARQFRRRGEADE